MSKDLAIYKQGLRYELPLSEDKPQLLSDTEKATFHIQGLPAAIRLSLEEDKITYEYNGLTGELSDGVALDDVSFYRLAETYQIFDLLDKQEIYISQKSGSDFCLENADVEAVLQRAETNWQLTLLAGSLYVNNVQLTTETIQLSFGDELSFGNVFFKFFGDEVWVKGPVTVTQELIEKTESNHTFYEEYPDYHRSPRIIYRSSEDTIAINAPAKEPNKPQDGLLRMIVPPLVMVSVTILISLIQPRGIYILVTMAMSVVTVIFSVTTYIKNRKQYKVDLRERIASYHRYLSDKAIELNDLAQDQKQGQLYHYPAIETLDELSAHYNHRIYEKTPLHFDFLYYRLGLGKVPTTYALKYSQTERSGQTDPLEAEGYALYRREREISGMPIVANLAHGPVGYIGPRPLVLEQLQLMVNQLAFFHSYHDVQFITIMPEEELPQWEWMRWLPHATLQGMNVRGFVYNQRTRDQVLNSLTQILKLRRSQQESKESAESTLFSPHYVVIVTDEKLILDHVIMEFFTEDPTALGCSIIFVEDVLSSLSENIKTIINVKDRNHGQLVMEEGELREVDFALDHFPADYDKEAIARRLAPLNHLQNLKSSIPDRVTFMEMYHAESVEELKVPERWDSHAPYKSLAVPLGLRGQDDVVSLNLHERAHGPHGLIAGTTGSGKSELIQSYILSLAVNFHPYDVAFLLIDYKGGGMANLFKDLPHLLGTITNLDGAQAMRALTSINAEIHRRERLFAANGVNHINQYQKKYKLGEVAEPLPHLFLISDEFAELKQEQPDFMSALVSTARTGRSLGIHLILATQKPAGVVNDQIWSNSRFKIALKVADRQDSNEMLHTPDAAEITQTGRAYLQVGNNEVYELFQSAWSGADYQPDKDDQGIEDQTIYAINALGQYDILNDDLSGLEDVEDIRQVPSELDAIVHHLHDLTQTLNPLARPWLPPLATRVYSQDLRPSAFQDLWQQSTGSLKALIGLVDLPSQQAQKVCYHDFEVDGNVVLFSAPGNGKSTFLQTLTMDLARQNTPELLHCYLFDFGTNGLLPLRSLPHVADNFMMEDSEKITKFILRMKTEMATRKKRFSQYGVSNIKLYRQLSGEQLPEILIMIDSYDGIKEAETGEALEAMLQTLLRDGASLGINVAITAGRIGVLKSALLQSLKTRLALKTSDDNDTKTIIGRHDYLLEDIPGRGILKYDDVEVFQTALPARGEDSVAMLQALQEEAEEMAAAWTGPRPNRIPVVPEKLSLEDFMAKPSVQEALHNNELPIGLDMIHVENVSISLNHFRQLAYVADNNEALDSITRHLLNLITHLDFNASVMLLDSDQNYKDYAGIVQTYINDATDFEDMNEQLIYEVKKRQKNGQWKEWFIILPNLESYLNLSQENLEQWTFLLTEAHKVGMYLIIGGLYQYLGIKTTDVPKAIRTQVPYFILGMRLIDQNFLDKVYNSKEQRLVDDEIYLHDRKSSQKLKITS